MHTCIRLHAGVHASVGATTCGAQTGMAGLVQHATRCKRRQDGDMHAPHGRVPVKVAMSYAAGPDQRRATRVRAYFRPYPVCMKAKMAPLNRAQACVALGVALLLLCNLIYRSHTPPLKPTLATPALVAHPPPPPPSPPPLSLYVFATFTDGRTLGEGMHLLVSSDGLSWRTLQGALLPGTARWWRRLS